MQTDDISLFKQFISFAPNKILKSINIFVARVVGKDFHTECMSPTSDRLPNLTKSNNAQFAPGDRILWAAGIAPAAAIGRDIAVIKKLMLMNVAVPPEAFCDPTVSLKSLLIERASQC